MTMLFTSVHYTCLEKHRGCVVGGIIIIMASYLSSVFYVLLPESWSRENFRRVFDFGKNWSQVDILCLGTCTELGGELVYLKLMK